MVCDLADLDSVRACAAVLQSTPIDSLCNNAGLAMNTADKEAKRTAQGFELTVGLRWFLGKERGRE
jgi:short-subunit dehydrogenase